MTSESPAIRVRTLTSMLDGNDPVEFVHRLFEAGYDRFYVKVPQGFQVRLFTPDPYPPGYQLSPRRPDKVRMRPRGDQRQVRYLRLDTAQVRNLIEYPPIALHQLDGGGLDSASAPDGLTPIDFKYREGMLGALIPIEAAIADSVPTEFAVGSGGPVVVKILNSNRSRYSYVLHGIYLKDVFVEEPALSDALERTRIAKAVAEAEAEAAPLYEDLPDDPYGLRDSAPLVYEILRKAHQNRDKTRSEIGTSRLEADFQDLNAGYDKNPKPFNSGRHKIAATLANPGYSYPTNQLREIDPPERPSDVPSDPFLDHEFINANLKKVLYAACCWSGAMEPRLGDDREKLVDLLVGLGFYDADDTDQVQAFVYFITGQKYRRGKHKSSFRHIRGDRK